MRLLLLKERRTEANSETDFFSCPVISIALGDGEPFYIYIIHLGTRYISQSVDAICAGDTSPISDRLAVLCGCV